VIQQATADAGPDPAGSLSNRKGTGSFFELDRISLSFPVHSWEQDRSAWNTLRIANPGTPMEAHTFSAALDLNESARVFVGIQEVPATGQTWAKLEWNPARQLDPGGHSLAPVAAIQGCAVEAVDVALSLLEPAVPDAGAMKVRRLDVARDFVNVDRPSYIVSGLGPVHRPWARRNLVHYDPGRKGAQTLMVGSGAGVVRLYDKEAETEGKAAGVLRWEVEARRDWCQKYGEIANLRDVNEETVSKLGQDRWQWSAMGTEVSAMEAVVEKVMRSGLSFAEQRALIGYMTMIAAGADVRAAKATHAKYRTQARKLGVTMEVPNPDDDDSAGFSARLDLDSGTVVYRV
jgi:hypothetical protein